MSIPVSTALFNFRLLDLLRVRAGQTWCRILADFGAVKRYPVIVDADYE
jgi:hypothetical protein